MRANGLASIDIFNPLGGQIIIVINECERGPIWRGGSRCIEIWGRVLARCFHGNRLVLSGEAYDGALDGSETNNKQRRLIGSPD